MNIDSHTGHRLWPYRSVDISIMEYPQASVASDTESLTAADHHAIQQSHTHNHGLPRPSAVRMGPGGKSRLGSPTDGPALQG